MTDTEIIKALECCIKSSHFGECFENKCPLVSEKGCMVGKETLYPYALDLINRHKAEIGTLEKAIKVQEIMLDNQDYMIKKAKAEAVKEFAEILKGDAVGWLEITVDDIEEAKRKVLNRND